MYCYCKCSEALSHSQCRRLVCSVFFVFPDQTHLFLSLFCYAVLSVLSSFAINSLGKRELIALLKLSSCRYFIWLYVVVYWSCLFCSFANNTWDCLWSGITNVKNRLLINPSAGYLSSPLPQSRLPTIHGIGSHPETGHCSSPQSYASLPQTQSLPVVVWFPTGRLILWGIVSRRSVFDAWE